MSDPAARERLLDRIGDVNDFSRPRPLVGLEEFFVGNDDPASIGYNLPGGGPGPQALFGFLRAVRDRPEVVDVLVEVKDLEDPDGWPSSDSLYVITAEPPDAVRSWFPSDIAPDEWGVAGELGPPATEPRPLPPGTYAVHLFYD